MSNSPSQSLDSISSTTDVNSQLNSNLAVVPSEISNSTASIDPGFAQISIPFENTLLYGLKQHDADLLSARYRITLPPSAVAGQELSFVVNSKRHLHFHVPKKAGKRMVKTPRAPVTCMLTVKRIAPVDPSVMKLIAGFLRHQSVTSSGITNTTTTKLDPLETPESKQRQRFYALLRNPRRSMAHILPRIREKGEYRDCEKKLQKFFLEKKSESSDSESSSDGEIEVETFEPEPPENFGTQLRGPNLEGQHL